MLYLLINPMARNSDGANTGLSTLGGLIVPTLLSSAIVSNLIEVLVFFTLQITKKSSYQIRHRYYQKISSCITKSSIFGGQACLYMACYPFLYKDIPVKTGIHNILQYTPRILCFP